jgi:hypothetical protein
MNIFGCDITTPHSPSSQEQATFLPDYGKSQKTSMLQSIDTLETRPSQCPDSAIADHDENKEADHDDGYHSQEDDEYASIDEDAYNARIHHGRECHIYGADAHPYPFSNDKIAQEREGLVHVALMKHFKELHWAPIKSPHRVLDIGAEIGDWAIDCRWTDLKPLTITDISLVSEKHPSTNVRGADVSNRFPVFVPQNVDFFLEDMELTWGSVLYDFIHARFIAQGWRSWGNLLKQSFT